MKITKVMGTAEFRREFCKISREIESTEEVIGVTRDSRMPVVVMSTEAFERLINGAGGDKNDDREGILF